MIASIAAPLALEGWVVLLYPDDWSADAFDGTCMAEQSTMAAQFPPPM
jgi:hypothetical protein